MRRDISKLLKDWVYESGKLNARLIEADDGTPRQFHERGVKPRKQDLETTGFSDHLPVVTRLRRVPAT